MCLLLTGGFMDLAELIEQIDGFVAERDWEQYHTPKNIAISVAIEAGELLECAQWDHELSADEVRADPARLLAFADEVADVQIYLLRMCAILDIDPVANAARKLALNREKYPAGEFSGSSRKYDA